MSEDSNSDGRQIVGYKLNPELVRLHCKGLVDRPEASSPKVLMAFSAIKPGDVVDEATYRLVRHGLNARGTHAGKIFVKGGNPLPVLVPVYGEPERKEIKSHPARQSEAQPRSLQEFYLALMADARFQFGGWRTTGEKECAVHANSLGGQACICGGYGNPGVMRGLQIGPKAYLAIGLKCAVGLREAGLRGMEKPFAYYVDVKPVRAPRPAPATYRRRETVLGTLESFARHASDGGFLKFSNAAKGDPMPCTLAVNGVGICVCSGSANVRNMYGLRVNGEVYPISPGCLVALRGTGVELDASDHSFAQERGWGADRQPVGDFTDYPEMDFGTPQKKRKHKPNPNGHLDHEGHKRNAAEKKARKEAERAARQAAPNTNTQPKKGGGKPKKGKGKRKKKN